jgi:quercetin dioxygenase-like cupin family protein
VERALREEELEPRSWANGPGDVYAAHRHPHHKVLVCVAGSIVFHTAAGDLVLEAGDRLELPPLVEHGATVGSDGVQCVEAYRR